MKLNKVILIGNLDNEIYDRYSSLRRMVDYRPQDVARQKCFIINEFPSDLGGAIVSIESNGQDECSGDGDDGDSGDGDPESDRRKLKSQKLSYIYKTPPHYQLPKEGFVRLRQILQVVPIGKSTWWAGVKSGRYPKPVRTLGRRITAWRVEDIHELIKNAA